MNNAKHYFTKRKIVKQLACLFEELPYRTELQLQKCLAMNMRSARDTAKTRTTSCDKRCNISPGGALSVTMD